MKTFAKVWLSIGLIAIVFGLGLLIIAFGFGSRRIDLPTYSLNESYDGIQSIDMDIAYGEVTILEGEQFHIEAEHLPNKNFEAYVTDGIWYIKSDVSNKFNLFGNKVSLYQLLHWNDDITPEIRITVPKEFAADQLNLRISAGTLEAETITANNGSFTVDAGKLNINQLSIKDKSDYNVGAGEMIINQIEAQDITVDCGVGRIDIAGTLTGDNDITCAVGRVDLNLSGQENNYSYSVEASVGNVIINGDSYHNIVGERIINNDADHTLNLECSVGNITVEFDQK
jgi:hypothetical protein